MQPAPIPVDEAHRLTVLRDLGMLDSESEGSFDALVQTAARITGCPIALIGFVDDTRHWFKAAHGLNVEEIPRDVSICAHAIGGENLFEVADTTADERFSANPLVLGEPHIRFYAGVPLQFRGATLGTLCVVDTRARVLTHDEREALKDLTRIGAELLRSRERLNALSAERRRLLDFGRASGDWMWETDERLRYTWVSEEVQAVTGVRPQALIGQTLADSPLVDVDGGGLKGQPQFGALLRQQLPFTRAVTEKHTPRGVLFVSRSAVPVFDDQGRFRGYRGTARDVTAQVRATRRSRTHDMLLRKLSSQVPGVIFQFKMAQDGTFSYPYASDGLREMFGVDMKFDEPGADQTVPLRVLHPDDRVGFMSSIRESAQALRPWQREYRIVRGDGNLRWLETRAMPERLPDGGTLWHGFTADISERKEIDLALRRSEERWEMAADAAGIGIAEVHLGSGLMSMDRRACLDHGLPYPLGRYLLTDWLAAMQPEDRETTQVGLQQALDSRTSLEALYQLKRADGSEVMLEITARGRYDAQGQPIGLVGTCRDVTAHHAFERLQRDKEAAERANRAKSEFLSRVSHELRTPLNGILGFAQVMALDREAPLAPSQQRRLASVESAGRRLLGLINDVLDVTRIENEDFSMHPCGVDAWGAIRECVDLIQPLADEAGVRVMPLGTHAPIWVHADPRALEQVLVNLLSNAIKYNRPGGRVEFDVRADESRVRIAVRDEGRGMNEHQRASLFQPFNRLGAENTRTEGSGLGLVICQRLLLAMGGALQVQSVPGTGSIFTVELPTGAANRPEPTPTQTPTLSLMPIALPSMPSTGPREVLYIEDEPLNMVLMEEVFRAQPEWTLLVADDGATGVRIASESRPDLILIDMNLPDMNGLALIGRLRSDPRTRPLRCIALSADAMREQIDAALAAGFDDYWTKPIDVRRVLSDLGKLLGPPSR